MSQYRVEKASTANTPRTFRPFDRSRPIAATISEAVEVVGQPLTPDDMGCEVRVIKVENGQDVETWSREEFLAEYYAD